MMPHELFKAYDNDYLQKQMKTKTKHKNVGYQT